MEKERKKAVRAAMRRMKEAKLNKNKPPRVRVCWPVMVEIILNLGHLWVTCVMLD
jgi:hypothetical protein